MYPGKNILLTILQLFLGGILQTSNCSSHTSIIFKATPTASRINGTGMKAAPDCNTFKACFPVAMIYCAVEGTTSRWLSEVIWIQMCVREKVRIPSIWINPLTAALEIVSITRSSTGVRSFVAETIAISSFSGRSCQWTQMCQRDGRMRINPLTAALEFVSVTRSSTVADSFVVETNASSFSSRSWRR